MQIKIIRQTVAQKRVVRVGEVIDTGEAEARLLIAGHKAELVDSTPSVAPANMKPGSKGSPRKQPAGAAGAKDKP